MDALHWLVENNPLYKNITINHGQLNALPENSRLDLVTKINFEADATKSNEINCKADSDGEEEQIGIDRGPIDSKLDQDLVFDENTEMRSFLPLQDDIQKEKDLITEKIKTCTSEKYPWQIGDYPFNEFRTEYLATMSFPTLFPDGIADPTSQATVRNISNNDTESFAQKIKHLIRFAEHVNGKWVYRLASHPRFAYWAYNILYRRRIFGQGNFSIKQNPGEANLTTDELRAMLTSNEHPKIMSKLMHYAKNVTDTNAYWNQVKQELKTTITQVGPPTIFWTLSCAEFHWPDFHSLFSSSDCSSDELRQKVLNNPHILDWFFTQRTERIGFKIVSEPLGTGTGISMLSNEVLYNVMVLPN